MNNKEPHYSCDSTNSQPDKRMLNNDFCSAFFRAITGTFQNVHSLLEAKRFNDSKNPIEENATIANGETKPQRFTRLRLFDDRK